MDKEIEETPEAEVQEQEEQPDQKFLDQQKRAEKAETEAKELKEQLEALETPELKEEEPTQFDKLADDLAVLNPLSTEEVEELRTQAKTLGVDPIVLAQSNAWKAQLDSLRVNIKAEEDTPPSSHRTAVYEGKSFADVVHDKEASGDTRQKAFEAQRDSLLKRGTNQNI